MGKKNKKIEKEKKKIEGLLGFTYLYNIIVH